MNSTASTSTATAPSLESLERIKRLLDSMPPEPIGEWMRSQGYPPESWRVIIPSALLEDPSQARLWPSYVQFSPLCDAVFFVRKLPLFDAGHKKVYPP